MREKIIAKASEMFLDYGFKSVTMDDLATAMGISKKTIYQYFANKTKLVEASAENVLHTVFTGIECIRSEQANPICELFQINSFVKQIIKSDRTAPQYQLQKYYPRIFKKVKESRFSAMYECVTENLKRGIAQGLYREEISPEMVARFYYLGATGIKDFELFPPEEYPPDAVVDNYLEYHLRGIVTKKGEKELIKHINQ